MNSAPSKVSDAPPRTLGVCRRFVRHLTLVAMLLGLSGIFLPSLISTFGLQNALLSWLVPELPPHSGIESIQLGWSRTIELRGLSIPAPDGSPLLTVSSIRTDRTLWELLRQQGQLGTVSIQEPELIVQIRPDGSNLGDLWNRFRARPKRGSAPGFKLRVEQGRIRFIDETGLELGAYAVPKAVVQRETNGPARVSIGAEAREIGRSEDGGTVQLLAEWQAAAPGETLAGPGFVAAECDHVRIDPLYPLWKPFLGKAAMAGDCTAALSAEWDELGPQGGTGRVELKLEELTVGVQRPDETSPRTWNVQNAQLVLAGTYDAAQDRFQLHESEIRSEFGSSILKGVITDLRGAMQVDVAGELDADLMPLIDMMAPELRKEIAIDGLRMKQITLTGPLRPTGRDGDHESRPAWEARTDIVWSHASAFGIESENAHLQVLLEKESLIIEPVQVPLSGGRLRSVPMIELGREPPYWVMKSAIYLEQVAFSEEMCRTWMKRLSPLFANATSVSGRFSMALNQGRVPIPEWRDSGTSGTLFIHSAQVRPGPMTLQIIEPIQRIRGLSNRDPRALVRRNSDWLLLEEQAVEFTVHDGRVYHESLTMKLGQVSIVSQGSVGFDDTLDLTIQVRFPSSWAENRPVLAELLGEGLSIPVHGTFQRWEIDLRAVGAWTRRIGAGAVDGLLKRLLNRKR